MSADWLWSPFAHTRWTTVGTALVILAVVTIVKRRPFLALATAMGWLVTFEIFYEVAKVLIESRQDPHLAAWASWLLTVAGWPFFAYAIGVRPHFRWAALSALIFAVWIQQGFHYNYPGQTGPINWEFEVLNVSSKTALGVAYLLGALRPERSNWSLIRMTVNRVRPANRNLAGQLPEG